MLFVALLHLNWLEKAVPAFISHLYRSEMRVERLVVPWAVRRLFSLEWSGLIVAERRASCFGLVKLFLTTFNTAVPVSLSTTLSFLWVPVKLWVSRSIPAHQTSSLVKLTWLQSPRQFHHPRCLLQRVILVLRGRNRSMVKRIEHLKPVIDRCELIDTCLLWTVPIDDRAHGHHGMVDRLRPSCQLSS